MEVGGLCVPLSVMQISVRGEHVGGSPAKILSARGSSEENENAHAPLKCFVLYRLVILVSFPPLALDDLPTINSISVTS